MDAMRNSDRAYKLLKMTCAKGYFVILVYEFCQLSNLLAVAQQLKVFLPFKEMLSLNRIQSNT
jgi:hypothetical protein